MTNKYFAPETLLASQRHALQTSQSGRPIWTYLGAFGVLLCFSSMTFSQTPAGWKTTQDMNRSCQISFPPTWSVNMPPDGQATTPEGTEAVVVVGSSNKLEPLTKDWQRLLMVERLIENSSQRVFYVTKPRNDKVQYIVDQQFKGTRCNVQIVVRQGHSEDEIMKIAATLAATH